MTLKPNKNYFLIRILKADQRERRDKIGSIVIPPALVFMTRNMQCGEILGIGENVKKHFPDANVGNILLFHHTVENDERLVHEDEEYKYYAVSGWQWKRKNISGGEDEEHFNETYAVFDGEKIITHPTFIFLETAQPPKAIPVDEVMNELKEVNEQGLLMFTEWHETRADMQRKIDENKKRIMSLSKMGIHRVTEGDVKEAIEKMEYENAILGRKMHQKKFTAFTVAAANEDISKRFGKKSIVNDTIYCLNIACETEIEFLDKKYLVCNHDHIGFIRN